MLDSDNDLRNQIGAIVKKFFYTTFLVLLLSSAAIAQPIVNIGELKIGMTEQEFLEISEIKSRNIQDAGHKRYNSNENTIWKKTRDSVVPESYARFPEHWKIYTPEYIKYNFNMQTGIKDIMGKDSYDTDVEFYKNELVSIRLSVGGSFSKFEEVLKEKYGNPITKNNMTKETCQNGYGAKTEHNTGSISSIWGETSEVVARLSIFNSSCGKYPGSSYSIGSKKSLTVFQLEMKAKQESKNIETKEKASTSKL